MASVTSRAGGRREVLGVFLGLTCRHGTLTVPGVGKVVREERGVVLVGNEMREKPSSDKNTWDPWGTSGKAGDGTCVNRAGAGALGDKNVSPVRPGEK